MIGPIVIQAIIDASGSNWMGFPFLFAMTFCAFVVIFFWVDVEKGRRDAAAWAAMRSKVTTEKAAAAWPAYTKSREERMNKVFSGNNIHGVDIVTKGREKKKKDNEEMDGLLYC